MFLWFKIIVYEKWLIVFSQSLIFLQGKILKQHQFKSNTVNKKILEFHNWCRRKHIDRISACINFVKNYKFINKITVGIENKSQLMKIISVLNSKEFYVPKKFKINKYSLIDPRKIKWN